MFALLRCNQGCFVDLYMTPTLKMEAASLSEKLVAINNIDDVTFSK
jgi:hypothetical protein